MKSLVLRIWFIASITCALGAAITRLAWEIPDVVSAGSLVIIILLMVAVAGTYALILYLTIKPSMKKLRSLLVAILATIIVGGGCIGSIVHYIRFVPSSNASSPLSVVIASLLMASGIGLGSLILWVVWRYRRRRKE